MLKLYHYDRSTAAQRVRLGLEEKELEWESIIVDTAMGDADQRPDNFHEFNPKGLIPLLDHNGFMLPESTLILEYLDDAFSEVKTLTPATCQDRARMKLYDCEQSAQEDILYSGQEDQPSFDKSIDTTDWKFN